MRNVSQSIVSSLSGSLSHSGMDSTKSPVEIYVPEDNIIETIIWLLAAIMKTNICRHKNGSPNFGSTWPPSAYKYIELDAGNLMILHDTS